jgi:hypothetical protein
MLQIHWLRVLVQLIRYQALLQERWQVKGPDFGLINPKRAASATER